MGDYRSEEEVMAQTVKTIIKWAAILVGIMLLLTVFRPWQTVPAGHVGVITHFGSVSSTELTEGLHGRVPVYTKIVCMNTQIQKVQVEASAASKDLQTVNTAIAVNMHILPSSAAEIYQRIGLMYTETVVQPAIQESVKSVTAKYTAEELISKRPEVASAIQEVLSNKLKDYNIIIDKFNIINFNFSDTFNAAIEAKQEAEQKALKARQDLARIEVEAEQKIASAKAEAESLRLQKQEVTPELLELRKIENENLAIQKWDGKLPNVTGGGAVPFINVTQ